MCFYFLYINDVTKEKEKKGISLLLAEIIVEEKTWIVAIHTVAVGSRTHAFVPLHSEMVHVYHRLHGQPPAVHRRPVEKDHAGQRARDTGVRLGREIGEERRDRWHGHALFDAGNESLELTGILCIPQPKPFLWEARGHGH